MIRHIRMLMDKYFAGKQSFIYPFSFIIFFWTIFDSIMSYIIPILIEERGFSKTMIGAIISTSSIAGALFDFLICKYFKNTSFKRIFLIMFLICSIYPLLLWQAKTAWFFIFAMAVWGLYYDLCDFGIFNFVGRYTKKLDHSPNFGIVQIFKALGSILAPIIAGLVIVDFVDWRSFSMGWMFLIISFIFFIVFLVLMKKYKSIKEPSYKSRKKNLFIEIHLWKKIGRTMFPVLFITFYLFVIDSFFWTLGPLYGEVVDFGQFNGLFLSAYILPELIVGWLIGSFTSRWGKKRVAIFGLLIGSVILSFFFFFQNPIISIIMVFIASLFINISFPAINGAYADYISEAPEVEGEIESLEDFSFNAGYVVGPFLAGLMADNLGMGATFSFLGFLGVIVAIVIFLITPKHIAINVKASEL